MDPATVDSVVKLIDVSIRVVEVIFGARKGRSKKAAVRRTVRAATKDALPVPEIDQHIEARVSAAKEAGEI